MNINIRQAWRRPLVLLLLCLIGPGAESRAGELDDTIRALMAKRRIPGLSLAVIKDGVIVKAQGYGLTAMESGNPVTVDTLFQAGSVSKPVTALGALRLVEEEKLSLDADINGVLQSWRLPANELTTDNPVTLRRLLSHSAGTTVHGFPGYVADAPVPTLLQVLNGEQPANTPPVRVDLTPGSQWRYSGGGYTIVQQAMVDVTGGTFEALMERSVLGPLGMRASTFAQPLPESRAVLAASGHRADRKPVPGRWHIYPEMAAAGLWTTPSDLARFVIALQKSCAGESHPVLSPESAGLMVTKGKGDFSLGFRISGQDRQELFEHNGRDEGFDVLLRARRYAGLGAVVMINTNDNSLFMTRVMDAIAKEYDWPGHVPYATPAAVADTEPHLAEQLKAIFLARQAGVFDADLYVPEFAQLLARVIPGSATQTARELGELKSVVLVRHGNRGTDRLYQYHVVGTSDAALVQCVYRADGKIAFISVQLE